MLGRIFNSEQSLTPADDLNFFSLHLEILGKKRYTTTHLAGSEPGLDARIFIVFWWFLLFFEGLFHSLAGKTCRCAQVLLGTVPGLNVWLCSCCHRYKPVIQACALVVKYQ